MKTRYLWGMALLASGLTACQNELAEPQTPTEGGRATLRVTLQYPGMADESTRTVLTETEEGGLHTAWEQGDKVIVSTWGEGSATGTTLGVLDIVDIDNEGNATFMGELEGVTDDQDVWFTYLGRGVETSTFNPTEYTYRTNKQKGTLEGLAEVDMLRGLATLDVADDGTATCWHYEEGVRIDNFKMKRDQQAYAHFELQFSDGAVRGSEPVTINSDAETRKLCTTLKVRPKGISKFVSTDPITISGGEGNDIYVGIVAQTFVNETMNYVFTVTIDGKTYTGAPAPKNLTAGNYYRKEAGKGIPVAMTAPVSTEPDHSKNPLLKWAESDLKRSGTGYSVTATFTGDPFVTGSYYQFGRNYGWNSASEAATNYGVEKSQLPSGRNIYPGTGSTSACSTFLASSVNFSAYPTWFLIDQYHNGDYTTISKYSNQTWQERAKSAGYTNDSPCPEGWRLPTVAEYKEILPVINGKAGVTEGNLIWYNDEYGIAQIKTLADNSKCAFRWRAYKNGTSYYYLKIDAQMVSEDITSVGIDDNDFWNNEKTVSRYFKLSGYIDGHVNLWSFWTAQAGTSTQYTARPLDWGSYDYTVGGAGTAGVVIVNQKESYMKYGGFYWTSDAVKGTFSIVLDDYNKLDNMIEGIYVYHFDRANAFNIRCVKAD